MNREHVAFLAAGLAFGILFGYALFRVVDNRPLLDEVAAAAVGEAMPAPRGPMAPNQVGGSAAGGGAPMVEEVNRLKRLVQENPQDLGSIVRLANLYHDVGMWPQAVGFYKRALTVKPDDPDLLTDLGICYRGMQEFEQALEVFDRAHALHPNHWQSLFNKVVVAGFDVGRTDAALQAIDSMEAITPRPAELTDEMLTGLREALERSRSGQGAAS